MELSIDSSTRYASVGLSRQGESVSELTWRSERNHSVELAPTIREMMGRARARMDQLEAVFVARGPGAFSALRVGMSTAKGLAMALGVPLVSVSTLDIEAQPYLGLGMTVRAVIEAGRDRLYLGRYHETLEKAGPEYEVTSYDEAVSDIESATLFCGEGVRAIAGLLRERPGGKALVADVPPPTRRASVLTNLAYRRWQAGDTDDPAALQPMYLRSSQINLARRTWVRT